MSESSDMENIVALLGNLVEKIEKVEEQQIATKETHDKLFTVLGKILEHDAAFKKFLGEELTALENKIGKVISDTDAGFRAAARESESAKRHGQINEWTGDLSRKLSEMQITLDRMEKKKGIFG